MRDEGGAPILAVPLVARPATGRQLHNYRMFNLGIRESETIERLWREAEAKRAAEPKPKKRRR